MSAPRSRGARAGLVRSSPRRALLALLVLACAAAPARASARDDFEAKPPDLFATAHQVYGWKSKNGLRFTWWLPKGFDPMAPAAGMTVILHGRGFDYGWGQRNHPAGVFRPDDVVIAVDGTSPDGDTRWFACEPDDAEALRLFLAEVSTTFRTADVLLYGHTHGGEFALYFAGLHPGSIRGLVAHAAAPPAGVARPAEARALAITFLAGTLDPEVPYRAALDARDAYRAAGFPLLHVRRLEGSSYEVDPTRAAEQLAWCEGMTRADPRAVLAAGLALLRPPQAATPGPETIVDFSGAREVLRRIVGEGPAALADVPPEVADEARAAIGKIEAAGALHVAALKQAIPRKKDLKLAAAVPLGHLVPLREDLRGVDAVEALVREYGFDALVEGQRKSAAALVEAWRKPKAEPKAVFEAVVAHLPRAFAVDGLPHDLVERMREWHAGAAKLGLSSKAVKKYPELEAWAEAWQDGRARYAAITKTWTGP